jgi:Flp pilus assembly protein TadG
MSLRAMNAMTLWLPRLLARFAGDRRGVSAVEFALLAPVMIALYLGLVEISDGIGVDRKVSLTSSTLANLTASCTSSNTNSGGCPNNELSTTEMNNILDASSAIVAPYSTSTLALTVSCLNIDSNKKVTVMWSVTRNGTARSGTITIPTDLQVPDSQLILAEASYIYTPIIGYTITGSLDLSDRMYMGPRVSAPSYNGVACAP